MIGVFSDDELYVPKVIRDMFPNELVCEVTEEGLDAQAYQQTTAFLRSLTKKKHAVLEQYEEDVYYHFKNLLKKGEANV